MSTPPLATGTMTRFGTTLPGVKLRFDAKGSPVPWGNTVRNDEPLGPTAVTLSTTADTPVAGTPPAPLTGTKRVLLAPSRWPAFGWPDPARVSVMRAGGSGLKVPPGPGP